MANIGEDTGIPSVEPDTRGISVTGATPDAFGAGIGEAIQGIGQAGQKVTNFYGQVAADNATNNWHEQANKILYGDPHKMVAGPDGTQVPDTGYFGLKGADAMAQRAQVATELDRIAKENRSSLYTPESQLQFDSETRRQRFSFDERINSHADQQQSVWATNTNSTKAKIALNNLGRAPDDPATKAQSVMAVRQAYVRNAQMNGEGIEGALLKADQDIALTQIRALTISNPPLAQQVLDASSGTLASLPNYDTISRGVKQAVINSQMAPAIDQMVDKVKADALANTSSNVAKPVEDIKQALLGQESGNRDNIPNSVQGAVGPGQMKPETFARFAKPGEKITNPDDNRRVSGRYVDYLSALPIVQGDPARIAVGYFGGEGNIAPPGAPTPYLHDYKDKNGKSTSSYVADVTGRLGGATVTPPNFDIKNAPGMIEPGNLDPWHRPVLHNPDGGYSTTSSFSIGTDKGETLIPSVIDGKRLSQKDAIAHFEKTGENLGTFKTPEDADKFATALHNAQASMYDQHGNPIQQQRGGYASPTDYIMAHSSDIHDQAQKEAEKLWPQYPDAQERYVQSVDRHVQQTISQFHQQFEVDTHTVDQAFASNHPPITEAQLLATSPEVAAAFERMKVQNPEKVIAIENRFNAAAHGQAKTYGSQFNTMLERVLAPAGDPNRITNPADLWTYVQPGEHAPLTNTGASRLSALMNSRKGAQGEADAAQLRDFLRNAHHMINPIQDEKLGMFYPKGEQAYQSFVAQAFPMIEAEQKQGKPLSVILKDKGDVYNSALSFTKSPMQIMNARMNDVRYDPGMAAQRTMDATMKQVKTPDDLVGLFRAGKINRAQFDDIAVSRKWARPPQKTAEVAPPVPFTP